MNVGELIEKLEKLPKDAMVVRRGYEGGVSEATEAYLVNIELNVHTDWYYGKHEIIDDEDVKNVQNTSIAVSIN